MPRVLSASMWISVAMLASGCGGTTALSTPELERTIVVTRDRVDFALTRITRAQSKDELLERMDEAADTIDDAAADLEGARPPADYATEVDLLVEPLHQLAFDVRATADQIRQPGFGELLSGTSGLSFESWDNVNLALAGLRAKGIQVMPLARH